MTVTVTVTVLLPAKVGSSTCQLAVSMLTWSLDRIYGLGALKAEAALEPAMKVARSVAEALPDGPAPQPAHGWHLSLARAHHRTAPMLS